MKYIELPSNLFKLINYIQENDIKSVYKKDLAEALDLSISQISKQLADLSLLGYIRKRQEGGGQEEISYKAEELLNALDNQFGYTLEPKTKDDLDNKIDEFNNKSKAEPLKAEDLNSEVYDHTHLDQNIDKIGMTAYFDEECLDSQFNHKTRDKEVCLSSGDIKQHNSLLDRVERLEQIIGDK